MTGRIFEPATGDIVEDATLVLDMLGDRDTGSKLATLMLCAAATLAVDAVAKEEPHALAQQRWTALMNHARAVLTSTFRGALADLDEARKKVPPSDSSTE